MQTKLHRDTLWSEKGIDARGHDYEQLRRANLGSNCPVVDDIVIDAMTATSMKTLDLALKSYQDIREVDSTVRKYIDELSGFTYGRWKDMVFERGRNFQDRYLELGIPAGRTNPEQTAKLHELQDYAQSRDVTLVIVEVP
ncbi:MAG: hypothetical protein M1575_02840 [Patescibacteria group bacterium]|nr:hypothetical protein [Patescibacteria group bacterium]